MCFSEAITAPGISVYLSPAEIFSCILCRQSHIFFSLFLDVQHNRTLSHWSSKKCVFCWVFFWARNIGAAEQNWFRALKWHTTRREWMCEHLRTRWQEIYYSSFGKENLTLDGMQHCDITVTGLLYVCVCETPKETCQPGMHWQDRNIDW